MIALFYYGILYFSVSLAAIGQVLLKRGAGERGRNLLGLRLNPWVILGLGIMALSMLLSIRGLSVVPLRDVAFILPTVYLLVPLFSRIFLGEQMGKRTVLGTLVIIVGIVLFHMPFAPLFQS